MGRFGEFLVRRGRIRPEHLKKAMEFQHMVGGRLGTNVLELGLVREQVVREELGKVLGIMTATAVHLKNVPLEIIRLIPAKVARRYSVVPVQRKDNLLVVASTEPGDPLVEDELSLLTTYRIKTVVGLELRVHGALEKYYGVPLAPRLSGLLRRLDAAAAATAEPPPPAPATSTPAPPQPEIIIEPPPPLPVPPVPQPSPMAPTMVTEAPAAPEEKASPVPVEAPVAPASGPAPGTSEPELQYIEIDEDTRAGLYSEDDTKRPAAERLRSAAQVLQQIDIRDEIGDVILDFCRPYFRRRLLLIHRKKQIIGWRGEGEGVEFRGLRSIDIQAEEPSVFSSLMQGMGLWRGLLPKLPANQMLIEGLGGPPPKECLILPITLRSRFVCFFYGDNGDQDLGDLPLSELKRLVTKAGVAFEVYILKNKIRTL